MVQRNDADMERGVCDCASSDRRKAAGLILATGLAAVVGRPAWADADPAALPPQAGDILVHTAGTQKGEPVRAAEVTGGETLLVAWAKDPASGALRDKSRFYRVLLLRLDPAGLDANTTKRAAAGGIVGYSDFCTHAGCLIENYLADQRAIFCHCHGSMFDPRASAKVIGGPAKRPLAALPLKLNNDVLVVAGPFEGQLGIPKG